MISNCRAPSWKLRRLRQDDHRKCEPHYPRLSTIQVSKPSRVTTYSQVLLLSSVMNRLQVRDPTAAVSLTAKKQVRLYKLKNHTAKTKLYSGITGK